MPATPPVKWVFFDVGDVLFDETPPHRLEHHTALSVLRKHGKPVLWDAYDARRIEIVRDATGPLGPTMKETLASFCDSDAEADVLWDETRDIYEAIRAPRPYGVLLDGIQPMLQRLAGMFKMGVIANQHAPCLDALRNYGLGEQLEVMVISEIVGLEKPDLQIYRHALEKAGCAANESVFVGDRPDDDTAPAKAVGMRTIRFQRGCHYAWADPRSAAEIADATVRDLGSLEWTLRGLVASR
jgi:HAD superfamily hydrolase (TIGR01549 family)